jgi:hypothetical protein
MEEALANYRGNRYLKEVANKSGLKGEVDSELTFSDVTLEPLQKMMKSWSLKPLRFLNGSGYWVLECYAVFLTALGSG